jgi:DNA-binding transcriptional regulator YiaG
MKEKQTGLGVDASGAPVVDPTANVIALVAAEKERADDLRRIYKELTDTKVAHQKEIGDLHAKYQNELRIAEAGRLDSIRQVDREEVKQMRQEFNSSMATLANTTTQGFESLRNQQTGTAKTLAEAQQAIATESNKRLSAVELQLSATGAGTAGEKSGRISQQQLIQWFVYLVLAAIAVYGFMRKG